MSVIVEVELIAFQKGWLLLANNDLVLFLKNASDSYPFFPNRIHKQTESWYSPKELTPLS